MKYTLLEMTQEVLSALDSDQVNSIADTVESEQVSHIIRTVYFDIAARAGLPEHKFLFQLDSSGDDTKPVLMTIPAEARHLDWLKYDKMEATETAANYREIQFLEQGNFIDLIHTFSEDSTNVDTMTVDMDGVDVEFFYKTDKHPDYYTIYNDFNVIFDSYQSSIDTTLQSSKTLAYGEKAREFTLSDSFTPELDEKQFTLLLNEAKKMAFAELKQTVHPVAADNARRQWINLRKRGSVEPPSYFDRLPNYGRK